MTNKEISNIIDDKNNINKIENKEKKPIYNLNILFFSFLISTILINFGAFLGRL